MFGHGTFIYHPDYALRKYGSAEKVVEAIKTLGMSHAWLRVHSATGLWKTADNMRLAEALRTAGISIGVWGWNDGNDVQADIENMREAIRKYDPDCYVADIEHGVSGARWNVAKAETFGRATRAVLGGKPLVVSSFGYIRTHQPEIMTALDSFADFFAPQVYWFWYPKAYMLPASEPALAGLPQNDPAAYVKVCLHHWRKAVSKPIIVTGQAYWGEASGWTQTIAEAKLADFLDKFDGYGQIAGLNWWNFADGKAMSAKMLEAIRQAKLNTKFRVAPEATPESPPLVALTAGVSANSIFAASAEKPMVVATEGLYFRSTPQGGLDDNIIAELDYGDRAVVSGGLIGAGYVKAVVTLNDGEPTSGYLHHRYLREEETPEIERAVREAVREWRRFEKGNGVEYVEPYATYINEYWRARGYPNLDGRDRSWPWSAVFISFILENAGYSKTKFDIRHATYIHEAIQNRVTQTRGDFWGARVGEARPEVGDLICQWRGTRETTYDTAETSSRFESHTDIVIAVRDRAVITLGGNVANAGSGGDGVSVETKSYELSEAGFLPGTRRVFALMKNQHRRAPDVPVA